MIVVDTDLAWDGLDDETRQWITRLRDEIDFETITSDEYAKMYSGLKKEFDGRCKSRNINDVVKALDTFEQPAKTLLTFYEFTPMNKRAVFSLRPGHRFYEQARQSDNAKNLIR